MLVIAPILVASCRRSEARFSLFLGTSPSSLEHFFISPVAAFFSRISLVKAAFCRADWEVLWGGSPGLGCIFARFVGVPV